ncbi:PEP/pyruvate-binding domain-containing protein [Nitratidesulfovibrio liaohensis]|uniref:Phosphoenolpyruvate synthase n=1 Tax=Nitratidesulfovibrio liaohensis TaxID=2604158 RepID=A0ABY9QYU9_9BACT|nr:PEP/pyruvate-binding domain-containing protein [Nitratidesulfovibrio liaohensis]WMW64231.1 phosphoenolpyruvate synthase [Nitratidesulfovibrio liaohensis]
MGLFCWLPFRRKRRDEERAAAEEAFAARYHRFKLVLNAWAKLQEVMTEMELALCCVHPFGMQTVRSLCTRITTQVYQCIRQLDELAPGRYPELFARFDAIQAEVSAIVYGRPATMDGPLALPFGHPDLALPDLADPALTRLGDLRAALAPRGADDAVPATSGASATSGVSGASGMPGGGVPDGFIVTAAACQRLFRHQGLQEEIGRRVQASGGIRPDNLLDLSPAIVGLIQAAEVPDEVADALMDALCVLRARVAARPGAQGRDMRLLLRGRVWPQGSTGAGENTDDDAGGMTLWGPSIPLFEEGSGSDSQPDRQRVLDALRATLALKYSPQAIAYRRNRGLRDAGTCVCVGCFAVEAPVAGGIAYTGNPLHARDTSVHVYAARGLSEAVEDGAHDVDAYHVCRAGGSVRLRSIADAASGPVLADAAARAVAELALVVEERCGLPQEIDWLLEPDGSISLLHARPLPAPRAHLPESYAESEAEDAAQTECPPPALLDGGITAGPGVVAGPVHIVRERDDVRGFPDGAVLVAERDLADWGMLLDRAAAVVAERGRISSQLAAVAREFGKPAVFGPFRQGSPLDLLEQGAMVTVHGDVGVVYPGRLEGFIESAPNECNFMPGSPVLQALDAAAHHMLPLTLDPDSPDFKSVNCRTFHDLGRFCHEKAVAEMFRFGSQQRHAPQRVKQLQCDVPKQFWVVNLDDGFDGEVSGPLVPIARITSVPMRTLWRGMNAVPWQGPPPVDAKGFLSVMFEATANPHLDPAAQSAFFTERNYFMVSRNYCSLHSRFGFHFVAVESLVGERTPENYVVFQLRGGAANIERRVRRVEFVAGLLGEFDFACTVRRDALSARIENLPEAQALRMLLVAGYMTIHTRQLDMIMNDGPQLAERRAAMLADCHRLLEEADQADQIARAAAGDDARPRRAVDPAAPV